MAGSNLSLQNLVEAIMSSLAEAQDQVERQTLDNINQWLDDDGRPKMITMKVPSLHPDDVAKREEGVVVDRDIEVPLLTLIQNNPIKIKRLLAKFDISLGGVDIQEDDSNKGDKPLFGSETTKKVRKILSTDLFSGGNAKKREASMQIEFESGEPTEAYLKIQNELLKLF